MTANKTVEILSKEYPSAAEVASYTDEQLLQLTTYWCHKLRKFQNEGHKLEFAIASKEFVSWIESLPKEKQYQLNTYIYETGTKLNVKADWAKAADFLLAEIKCVTVCDNRH